MLVVFWARSLAWLERPADNREVPGSNPGGPTFRFITVFLWVILCLGGRSWLSV